VIRPTEPQPPPRADALASRFGTPLYVFDGEYLATEARAFQAAWGDDTTVAYSMKANPLLGITARLHHAGCWLEAASGFEYRSARRVGVPGHEIVFNGPMKTQEDLRWAMAEGATIVLDGSEQIRAAAQLARHAAPETRFGLRISPPDRGRADRFGTDARMAPAAARMLERAGLRLSGLHIHLGAYQLGPLPATGPPIHSVSVQYPVPIDRFSGAAAHLREIAERVEGIEWLDLGGGWPRAAEAVSHIAAVRDALGASQHKLIVEPGRALVRDAGWLLTRVIARRGSGAVVVDAGITQAPCVLWKRAPVYLPEARPGALRRTALFGPLCLQHDVLAREVLLPPLRVGDLVWVGQTGAYGMAQASPFIHLRPGAVMVENRRAVILRERETDDEALGAQAEPLLVGTEGRMVHA
jgi:diaminopimelate decarboxylase